MYFYVDYFKFYRQKRYIKSNIIKKIENKLLNSISSTNKNKYVKKLDTDVKMTIIFIKPDYRCRMRLLMMTEKLFFICFFLVKQNFLTMYLCPRYVGHLEMKQKSTVYHAQKFTKVLL